MMSLSQGAISLTRAIASAACLMVCPPAIAMEEFNTIVTIDELCALMACRQASEIAMRQGDGAGKIVVLTKKSPHVFQGVITVVSGEDNRYDITVREGAIHDIRLSQHLGEAALLSLDLSQPATLKNGKSELKITNSFLFPLKLRLEAMKPGKSESEAPLICEVAAQSQFQLRFDYPVLQLMVDLDLAVEQTLTGQCRAI